MNATDPMFGSLQCWNATLAQKWLCQAAQKNPDLAVAAFMTCFVVLLFCLPPIYLNAMREQKDSRCAFDLAPLASQDRAESNKRVSFSIEGAEDQCAVLAYMRQFGIPLSLPECLSVTRFTQADLVQIDDNADALQTTILVALDEDDRQPWRPMHVQVEQADDDGRSTDLLRVSLSLPQRCCPQSRNSYDDYFTQCLMVENFMQAVCDHRDHADRDQYT